MEDANIQTEFLKKPQIWLTDIGGEVQGIQGREVQGKSGKFREGKFCEGKFQERKFQEGKGMLNNSIVSTEGIKNTRSWCASGDILETTWNAKHKELATLLWNGGVEDLNTDVYLLSQWMVMKKETVLKTR